MAKRGSAEWKENISVGIRKRQKRCGKWGGRPGNLADREKARELRRGGATFRQLADIFDVSVRATHYWAKDVTPLDGADLQIADNWNAATGAVHEVLDLYRERRKPSDLEDLHQTGRLAVWEGLQEGLNNGAMTKCVHEAMHDHAKDQERWVRHERSWREDPSEGMDND